MVNFISPHGVEYKVGGLEKNVNAFRTPQNLRNEKPLWGLPVWGGGDSNFIFSAADAGSDHPPTILML